MKRNCQGVRRYMSLSKGNIFQYHTGTYHSNTLSFHKALACNSRLPWAPLVSGSTCMMGKHGSTFSHKFPICHCHQSQNWSSACDLTRPGFHLIQSQAASIFLTEVNNTVVFIQVCFMKLTCSGDYEWRYFINKNAFAWKQITLVLFYFHWLLVAIEEIYYINEWGGELGGLMRNLRLILLSFSICLN